MSKRKKANRENARAAVPEDMRLNPELQLCPKFDDMSIAKFRIASRDTMGVRVVDNCAEEHIM